VIDLQTSFKPVNRDQNDYFIKVESTINSKGEFYHDSNGYLVIKRKVGERPDYKWEYRPEDKINANNYPMCSFAYAIDGDQKVLSLLFSLLYSPIGLKVSPSTIMHTSSTSIVYQEMTTRVLDRATITFLIMSSNIVSVWSARQAPLSVSGNATTMRQLSASTPAASVNLPAKDCSLNTPNISNTPSLFSIAMNMS
jgi:hypothetical protein